LRYRPHFSQDGFFYCVSKLCGLTNPLVDDFPETSGVRRLRSGLRARVCSPAPHLP
jgi:hypothetical protein